MERKYSKLNVIEISGTSRTIKEWSEISGVKAVTIASRINRGWNTEDAVFKEIDKSVIGGSRTMHGLSKEHPIEYRLWCDMICRCYNKNRSCYNRYGGRGITVCDRWRNSFENFLEDMGKRPSKKHQIDRIDNDGNYEPKNCQWATSVEQSRNRCSSHVINAFGQSKTLAEWSNEYNIQHYTLLRRLKLGWPTELAIAKPVRRHKPYKKHQSKST